MHHLRSSRRMVLWRNYIRKTYRHVITENFTNPHFAQLWPHKNYDRNINNLFYRNRVVWTFCEYWVQEIFCRK
jgi:hypothetical protein